ncbi:MAG TPA: aspartyl protease family protein [Pyrinomonadaceae bacterium]|nr:aspartyl protease family protein [Pyrinomonadaceae bacterium]
MKKFALTTLSLFTLLCAPGAARQDAVTDVPFTMEKGHVIVPATIKGGTPVEVILSTGARHSLIQVGLLDKYKLPAYYAAEGIVTGHNDRTYSFTSVSNVRVGTASEDLHLRYSEALAAISQRVGREIFASLGADYFKGRVVQFDFARKVVRFLPRRPEGGKGGGSAVLRMRPSAEPLRRPITEDVTVGGKKLKTLFDTGALTAVSLTPSAAKQVGLTAPPPKSAARTEKLGSLRLGEVEFNDVPVMLHAKDSDFDRSSDGFGAVVGVAVLQNFVVTFDFRDGVILLERI